MASMTGSSVKRLLGYLSPQAPAPSKGEDQGEEGDEEESGGAAPQKGPSDTMASTPKGKVPATGKEKVPVPMAPEDDDEELTVSRSTPMTSNKKPMKRKVT